MRFSYYSAISPEATEFALIVCLFNVFVSERGLIDGVGDGKRFAANIVQEMLLLWC